MKKDQQYWIEQLQLEPHSEGGYFKQVLSSDQSLQTSEKVVRPYYTSIYFLLTSENPSHFHRLKSDEVWYYHAGSPLSIHLLYPDGHYEIIRLGNDLEAGEVLQAVVPKNVIFGSTVDTDQAFALVSCMVSPGFDYQDFELFTKKQLLSSYPEHEKVIDRLAYDHLPD
ncbi:MULTISPECIES: cupin domain-containing protein [unclassified Enterococcus]|uniref:cupin domain-containing protein n=1 Tax=unclassified Enterococcus TaxID=2608891 RepID=UPI001CE1F664|nr:MULTISPECIES: cupin domain-containing protein [unclassified Enterococcus]MCA5014072.1 cupin domain-containing protein [Enterococcus sp. S23]MCA5017154.1 cupin domain-containing protein [Enterococcus sp. S22(2020)]